MNHQIGQAVVIARAFAPIQKKALKQNGDGGNAENQDGRAEELNPIPAESVRQKQEDQLRREHEDRGNQTDCDFANHLVRLLDSHAFSQVSWLVDVSSLEHGEVVTEELDRGGQEKRHQAFVRALGNRNPIVAKLLEGLISCASDAQDLGSARFHFFEIRNRLVAPMIHRCEHDDRDRRVDHRDRSVLELAGSISFGMNVGDFFQLQSSFKRDGIGSSLFR